MSVTHWSALVPDDSELRRNSLRVSLWVALLAYVIYILALKVTAEPGFLATFLLICAGLHSLALVAFYLGKTLAAAIGMVLVVMFCFTLMNILGFSEVQSAEYYFILVPALIFMVLPPQCREWQNTLLTLAAALLTLTFVLPEPERPWFIMNPEDYRRFKWLDIMVCFVCLAVVGRHLIQRLLQQRNQLERLALTDTLTGLPNRHSVMQQLARWYNHGSRFSILLLDIDDFRQINRRDGHDVGDMLMRKLAQRVRADINENIVIGRVGGDQFMLATNQTIQPQAVVELASRVRNSAARMSFDLNGRPERITVSIGATLSAAQEQPGELTQRLAQALRLARDEHADNICLLQPESGRPVEAVSMPSHLVERY